MEGHVSIFRLKNNICKIPCRLFTQGSVQFSCSVVFDSLRLHELQHARPPCPSPTPRVYSSSYPSSQWCHPAILSSVVPFSSCPPSLPASETWKFFVIFIITHTTVYLLCAYSHVWVFGLVPTSLFWFVILSFSLSVHFNLSFHLLKSFSFTGFFWLLYPSVHAGWVIIMLNKNVFVCYYFLSQIQSSLKYKYALCLWFCFGLLVNTSKIVSLGTKQVQFSRYCSYAMMFPSRKLDRWIDR